MSGAAAKNNRGNGLTPREIVRELDRYIIGQGEAKKAVAIALRNRTRRRRLPAELREEIAPKNIIMIGPTGVGKTEIARRLSRLAGAPFLKVEATKYTEVGYVGRDVESMVRDLTNIGVSMVRSEMTADVRAQAEKTAEERLLELLFPGPGARGRKRAPAIPNFDFAEFAKKVEEEGARAVIEIAPSAPEKEKPERQGAAAPAEEAGGEEEDRYRRTREKMRELLSAGKMEEAYVEVDVTPNRMPIVEVFSNQGFEEMDLNFQNILGGLLPGRGKKKRMRVRDARKILASQAVDKLIDMDKVVSEALDRVQEMGIIFIDEIDKVVATGSGHGPEVSRHGVQRDILPLVEGSSVNTRYGVVKTDHVLFIASGAFSTVKPSDLIPELQGRFPIRVELSSLGEEEFRKILVKPKNALIRQYTALLETEGITLRFERDAVEEIARIAHQVNQDTENIGARRLHTVMEKLLEDLSFEGPDLEEKDVSIDAGAVREKLKDIVGDRDLSRFIL